MSGKGDGWRKGTDWQKYREADYWKELEKRKKGADHGNAEKKGRA